MRVTITVPQNYSTFNHAKYKARALQYAVEQREKKKKTRATSGYTILTMNQ